MGGGGGALMSPGQRSPLKCYNIGHNGHRINLYDVLMIILDNIQT